MGGPHHRLMWTQWTGQDVFCTHKKRRAHRYTKNQKIHTKKIDPRMTYRLSTFLRSRRIKWVAQTKVCTTSCYSDGGVTTVVTGVCWLSIVIIIFCVDDTSAAKSSRPCSGFTAAVCAVRGALGIDCTNLFSISDRPSDDDFGGVSPSFSSGQSRSRSRPRSNCCMFHCRCGA